MASDWRDWRLLTIGNDRYRWSLSFNYFLEIFSIAYARDGASWPPDRLLIRPEVGPHRLLTVSWPACKGPVLTPRLARAYLDLALRRGWPGEISRLEVNGAEMPEEAFSLK